MLLLLVCSTGEDWDSEGDSDFDELEETVIGSMLALSVEQVRSVLLEGLRLPSPNLSETFLKSIAVTQISPSRAVNTNYNIV